MALRTPVLRLLGGLAVSTALLGVLPGQALASTPAPPTPAPAPPTLVAPQPAPAPSAQEDPQIVAPERAPGERPQVERVPRGAPATGGGSADGPDTALLAVGALGLAGAAGAAGAAVARRRNSPAA
jgi:hypothetical protein